MSVGFFMGIRESYIEEAADSAQAYIDAANRALAQIDAPPYVENPQPPDVYVDSLFGRSALDHDSARLLGQLGETARNDLGAEHLALLAHNPYRVAFLPVDFPTPLMTGFHENLFGKQHPIAVGSSLVLLREALRVAEMLNIPLLEGQLTDSVAAKINDYQPLFDGDEIDPIAEQRTTWLLVHEGAWLSVKHNIALSLAG
jgi:hypothetical protein